MPQNPEITPALRGQMEEVISTAFESYLTEFTSGLFPDYTAAQAQDCVVGGIAAAVERYQATTGRPIAHALALALLDINKD